MGSQVLTLESEKVSVIALGNLNPAIFQPYWFSTVGLLRREEAEAAEVTVIHNEAAVFVSEWLNIQVTKDRFYAATDDQSKRHPLRDLVVGTFSLLQHTPISAFGFNCDRVYQLPSQDAVTEFFDRIAPSKPWTNIFETPSVSTITMSGQRAGRTGRLNVRITPTSNPRGIVVAVNEHHILPSGEDRFSGTEPLIDTLQEEWETFFTLADQVRENLLNLPARSESEVAG